MLRVSHVKQNLGLSLKTYFLKFKNRDVCCGDVGGDYPACWRKSSMAWVVFLAGSAKSME